MLNLPKNIYSFKELRVLSNEDRRRYFTSFLLETLKQNPDGLMASELQVELKRRGYHYSELTLRKYLDLLVAHREAYTTQHGLSIVYHLNGKLMWDKLKKNINLGNVSYSLYEIDNPRGKFVFIQEKEKDSFNIENVTGGVVIPIKVLDEFISTLSEFSHSSKEEYI
jgi:repressor of nif and glnA expression